AISAGCAFSVRVRSPSGPSNIKSDSLWDNASSISSNSRRADGNAVARSRPIPTVCEPCPGNTNARFIRKHDPHVPTVPKPAEADLLVIAAPPPVSSGRCGAYLVPKPASYIVRGFTLAGRGRLDPGAHRCPGSSSGTRDLLGMPLYENVFIARQDISG